MHGLESEEQYEFRVAGHNEHGTGNFQLTSDLLLSHHIGVPSPPNRPSITSWEDDRVTLVTSITKFGSKLNFSLGYILVLNDTKVSSVRGMDFRGNFTLGEEVEVMVDNVAYRGDWRFAVLASNYLGSSLSSELSLRGQYRKKQPHALFHCHHDIHMIHSVWCRGST